VSTSAPLARGLWVVVFSVLLLLATAAFVVGVTVERNQGEDTSSSNTSTHTEAGEHAEGEGSAEGSAEPNARSKSAQASEDLLGVNPESTPVVVLAVLLALLLAGAVWWRPFRLILAAGVLFCVGAMALDLREVAHQLDENRGGVATIAGVVAALHLLAALAAIAALIARARNANGQMPAPS
jgi:hypothetical protein